MKYFLDASGFITRISPVGSPNATGGSEKGRPTVFCHVCGASVSQLAKHLRKAHPGHGELSSNPTPNKHEVGVEVLEMLANKVAPVSGNQSQPVREKSPRPNARKGVILCLQCGEPKFSPWPHTCVGRRKRKGASKITSHQTAQGSVPPPSGRMLVNCPQCPSRVRADRLQKHLATKCTGHGPSDSGITNQRAEKTNLPRVVPVSKVIEKQAQDTSPLGVEELRQSFDETRYGDKYLGQMRREFEGKFGSLPLYDDYGDEANAD